MMIRRRPPRDPQEDLVTPKGFDDYRLSLGDVMRGERATLGKSLLDVQRELRIKAPYIAAIENCDPGAFDTPGFIAGYVRSYARYLGMNPDEVFDSFCAESGFSVAHGMSELASGTRRAALPERPVRPAQAPGPFAGGSLAFPVERESLLSGIDARAISSTLVLVALIGGLGYGGWSVLREIQKVQMTPVDAAPVVLSDLDPLAGAGRVIGAVPDAGAPNAAATAALPTAESLDRLYRPQALDVPVLVARDAPISMLDPRSGGTLIQPRAPEIVTVEAELPPLPEPGVPQVVEAPSDILRLVAVRDAWVQVKSAGNSVIFTATMKRGDVYEVPKTELPPKLLVGDAGAVYFELNGAHFGPLGNNGAVQKNVTLAMDDVAVNYDIADLDTARHAALSKVVAELQIDAEDAAN